MAIKQELCTKGYRRSMSKIVNVVIFEANFQPEGFSSKIIPCLIDNKELHMVQAKWKFGKTYEILLCL